MRDEYLRCFGGCRTMSSYVVAGTGSSSHGCAAAAAAGESCAPGCAGEKPEGDDARAVGPPRARLAPRENRESEV